MAGKTNTEKIDEVTVICATLSARLDALLTEVRGNSEDQGKTLDSLTALKVQLTAVEVHVGGIQAIKAALETISVLEKELALLRKDVEILAKWKDELKEEKKEATRRKWSFGPNITAAIISGVMALATALLVLWVKGP